MNQQIQTDRPNVTEKSNLLFTTKEELASELLTLAANIESDKHAKYPWIGELYGDDTGKKGFYAVFKNLVSRTSHETAIKDAILKGHVKLIDAIDEYFQEPRTKIDMGIILAREYYKVLIVNGLIKG